MRHQKLSLHSLYKQLRHPDERLQYQKGKLQQYKEHLLKIQAYLFESKKYNLKTSLSKFKTVNPSIQIDRYNMHQNTLQYRLFKSMERKQETYHHQLMILAQALQKISPLTTLNRGYAIVTRHQQIITSTDSLQKNDRVMVQLSKGRLQCCVEDILQ